MGNGIKVKVIAHSASDDCPELVSLEVRYPWWLLPEMNTHRAFSRSYASTRAIPVKRLIEEAMTDPAVPVKWTGHQAGMQGTYDLTPEDESEALATFLRARDSAVQSAQEMQKIGATGLAKQHINKLLMPFIHVTGIITATDWSNFFALRCHPAADPTMQALAVAMRDAIAASEPVTRLWHLPYLSDEEIDELEDGFSASVLPMISAARCARVSYLNHDGTSPDVNKDLALARTLRDMQHMSPFEHVAYGNWRIRDHYAPSNLRGWTQFRKMIEAET